MWAWQPLTNFQSSTPLNFEWERQKTCDGLGWGFLQLSGSETGIRWVLPTELVPLRVRGCQSVSQMAAWQIDTIDNACLRWNLLRSAQCNPERTGKLSAAEGNIVLVSNHAYWPRRVFPGLIVRLCVIITQIKIYQPHKNTTMTPTVAHYRARLCHMKIPLNWEVSITFLTARIKD